MHGQPDSRLAGRRPFDSVAAVSRNRHVISWPQFPGLVVALESEPGGSTQYQHKLVQVLVVPEVLGRGMAKGDNAFNAHAIQTRQRLDEFLGEVRRNAGKEVFHTTPNR
mgnify:CR=1 FL=1